MNKGDKPLKHGGEILNVLERSGKALTWFASARLSATRRICDRSVMHYDVPSV
jgi:hypothetical protein